MQEIDWTSFKKRILIFKSIDILYNAWATQANMETWFLEKAQYYGKAGVARKQDDPIQKGDTFIWKWHNWDFDEKGVVLEANGRDRISFTFGKAGTVHVELKDFNSATEVVLTQEKISTDEKSKMDFYVGCSTGWTFWMTNLKAWLEHGVLLHAKGLSQADTIDLVNS
ncbi:SRPBCC domain-containing protein [Aquiflexum sp.]|uniref:SRPBCC family protein n=1 Tax=Aquiflexum sp. TaxID=1872584 RepID=UPI003593D34C